MERKQKPISIRLNGKEQVVQEVPVSNEIGAAEEKEIEEMIPQPDNVVDFTAKHDERARNGQPFWDDGNRLNSPKLPFKRKKKQSTSSNSSPFPFMLVAAIVSAIIVGVSLGLVILTVFTGEEVETVGVSEVAPRDIPVFAEGSEGLPLLTVEVVQGGAFTSVEKGKEVASSLQSEGVAAALTSGTDPIYMFIGAGLDRAQSTKISSLYEQYGQDTYLKSYYVDGQVITGQSNKVTTWFSNAISIYKDLLQLSVDGLNGGSMIQAEKAEQVKQSLDILQGGREAALMNVPEDAKASALSLADELVEAGKQLTTYVSEPDEKRLWSMQQSLLDGLIHYEQVIQSLQ